ncbi:biosynthetic arginine decarboxylase [Methylocucumis oryzae]|uniref:Arginine decarboxylase n=1 Tax=Methylocucumis oryzae TaxID=1632867 RepID=A0A0F3IR82_9GAMM|nr:biosynthetic arginine decarboxylase [Methylocucumis oryzae]KJV08099.1 arginine decarboxylase [Methylocucumis oryzae]
MNLLDDSNWTIQQAAEVYAIKQWGEGYFAINERGHVSVKPCADKDLELDLLEIAESLTEKQLSLPVLVRFTDILKDRVQRLDQAFKRAAEKLNYQGHYTPVYPIKVNQQRQVVEGILAADNIGLEAGSKPELLAIMALSHQGVVVCNGYKDRAYIRLALIGLKMGLNLYLVIEKPLELELIIEEATRLEVQPMLGLRVRLSSISAGKWQNSGGEKSKFGLHAYEVLQLVERLKQVNMLSALKLMHFHMGSQIANIHDIKIALKEAGQFYVELHRLGAQIKIVDAGGGLGVDYDGSRSRRESSINYSVDEYAQNIVRSFADVCAEKHVPEPDIITESGRALTAHHAVLITNVTDIETVYSDVSALSAQTDFSNPVEAYHDAYFQVAEARAQFARDKLNINGLAQAENDYALFCQRLASRLNPNNQNEAAILQELQEKLADKVFCNFSLFQSLPDIWGIDQVFPIMPIHRLNEKPSRRAVIQDLTCDSDGRIDVYVDGQNLEKTMPVHAINREQPYLIGFFMVGAYQEILGDMHNLFGDTHSINIKIDENGYQFFDLQEGEDVSELLDYVHISSDELKTAFKAKLAASDLSVELQQAYEQELNAGLNAYTYLEK